MYQAEWRFVLAVLATWRVTHLLVAEDGPWDAVVRLRIALGDSVAGRAMDCPYCLSLWVAAPISLWVTHEITSCVITWVAVSGAACLLDRGPGRREGRESAAGGGSGEGGGRSTTDPAGD